MLVKISALAIIINCLLFNNASCQIPNTLSAKETSEGWKLLFDGKDLVGWHSYLEKVAGKSMAGAEWSYLSK